MRPACVLSLMVFSLLSAAPAVQSVPRSTEAAHLSGRDYLRLSDWARANNFELRWLKRDETLQLSNNSSKLLFTVDSREARINGVQVWLLFPLQSRSGTPYLSRLDTQTTLQPLASPPRNRTGVVIKSICLDPGHGGKDPGNRVGSNQEKKYTLLLAQELRQQLTRAGLKVTLTRESDSFIELPTRPQLAKARSADLFISLHFNSAESSRNAAHGTEVYCLTPAGASSTNARGEGGGAGWFAGNRYNEKNLLLACQLQKSLLKNLETEDRGVRRARFAVLRDASMPAVLIEAGFMSHPDEGKKIFDPAYRRKMARAIVDGVLAYKRVVERPT